MFNLPDLEATAYETRGYKSRLVYGSHNSGSRELSAWSGCLYNEKQMGAAFAERIPYDDLTLVVAASQANCWAPSDRALSSKQWSTKAVQQTRHSGSRIRRNVSVEVGPALLLDKQIIVRKAGFHALRLLPSFKYSHVKSRGRPSMSALIQIPLKHRVFSAGAWSIAGHGVSLMIRVGTSLFMTRQLLPEKFGVMAIASMILVGLAMFSDVGLKPSVIQSNRGSESAFLNTAWTTQIIRGVLLWFFGLNISLLIFLTNQFSTIQNDSAYGDQSLPFVVAVLSFTAVIGGFESTKLLQAGRSLSLASITTIEIVAQIFGVVAMIIWVMTVDRSVWALVSGAVSASLAKSILSHLSLAGTPNRFQWEKEAFREIIHFGKWIFLSSILSFFAANGDRMILAGLINADLLGNYAIAFLVLSSVDQISTKMIVDVSFPALSEVVRERPASLSVIYYKFQVIIASFAYFCCGLLVVAGHTLIHAMYDERYQQAGWMLEILALALLTVPFRIATQCFLALGVAKIYFQLHAVRITSLFLAIPLGFHFFGLQGAMWGIVFSYFSNLPSTILYAKKFGLFNLRKELGAGSFLVAGLLAGQMLNYVISFIRHL